MLTRALAAAGVDHGLRPYSVAADFAARTIAGDLIQEQGKS